MFTLAKGVVTMRACQSLVLPDSKLDHETDYGYCRKLHILGTEFLNTFIMLDKKFEDAGFLSFENLIPIVSSF